MFVILNLANYLPELVATTVEIEKQNAQKITDGFVAWLLPLTLLFVSIFTVKFLFQRQMTQFFQFLGLTLLTLTLLLNPDILGEIAKWFGEIVKPGSSRGL